MGWLFNGTSFVFYKENPAGQKRSSLPESEVTGTLRSEIVDLYKLYMEFNFHLGRLSGLLNQFLWKLRQIFWQYLILCTPIEMRTQWLMEWIVYFWYFPPFRSASFNKFKRKNSCLHWTHFSFFQCLHVENLDSHSFHFLGIYQIVFPIRFLGNGSWVAASAKGIGKP